MTKLTRYLFLLLILLLPWNLGKHFDFGFSYVSGIKVDYLVPTIYIQDIVAAALILVWLLSARSRVASFLNSHFFGPAVFFVAGSFLSFLVSPFPLLSLTYFLRFCLYILVALYIVDRSGKDFALAEIPRYFSISIIFTSVLGIGQFLKQGSVFDNYLYFGEQPYSTGIKTLLRENFFNISVIPPYATFRHPNTFAGFLVLLLSYVYIFWQDKKNTLFMLTLMLGCIGLFLTFSFVAWVAFIFGILIYHLVQRKIVPKYMVRVLLVGLFLSGILLPLIGETLGFRDSASFSRRIELLQKAYAASLNYLPFGMGVGTSTSLFARDVFLTRELSFFQPVHNIFVLTLLESGVVPLASFLYFLYLAVKNDRSPAHYACVLVIQILLVGSFDHYLVTMHQTLLLMLILTGLSRASNKDLLAKN